MRTTVAAVSIAFLLLPRVAGAQGNPLGPEFRVNTYTTDGQCCASVAADASGRFVVVWSALDAAASAGIFGQRFEGSGVPLGPEFRVNTYTTGNQYLPVVASDPSGNFVVVWNSNGQDGSYSGVYAQRFDAAGSPLGPEFRVNTYTNQPQRFPAVAMGGTGDFVVMWENYFQIDVFGQRFASSGVPLGPESRANTFIGFNQAGIDVAADSAGNFVVMWSSEYQATPAGPTVHGQRFASSGAPLGPEFRVNTYTSFSSIQVGPSVSMGPLGDFVAVWESQFQEGPNWGVYGQRFSSSGSPLGPEFPGEHAHSAEPRSLPTCPWMRRGTSWPSGRARLRTGPATASSLSALTVPACHSAPNFGSTPTSPATRADRLSRQTPSASSSWSGTARRMVPTTSSVSATVRSFPSSCCTSASSSGPIAA